MLPSPCVTFSQTGSRSGRGTAALAATAVALVLAAVQDRSAAEVAEMDIAAALAPFDLTRQLSSNRTQGIPNMIALIRETAARYA